MQHSAKKTTALAASVVTIGFSSLFMGVGVASAAPVCSNGATLISSNVCELRITTVGATTVTPTPDMSKLEVLLVGGGGNGTDSSQGYGSGGGGGEVTIVGFGSDTTTPLDVVVGGATQPSTANQGTTTAMARAGQSASTRGGASGNGNLDYFGGTVLGSSSGGGAGASAANQYDGGAGATVGSVAPVGSLFAGGTECYGGGGAIGIFGGVYGTASCGGGYATAGATEQVPVAPVLNTGGGGSGGGIAADNALRAGASGLVVLRWVALDQITVTFAMNGHGTAVASQTFLEGGMATPPADPTAAGQIFNGWFTDAALTIPADFTVPLTASTTFYASWTAVVPNPVVPNPPAAPALAPTGGSFDPYAAGIGLGALVVGAAVLGLRARTRRAN